MREREKVKENDFLECGFHPEPRGVQGSHAPNVVHGGMRSGLPMISPAKNRWSEGNGCIIQWG